MLHSPSIRATDDDQLSQTLTQLIGWKSGPFGCGSPPSLWAGTSPRAAPRTQIRAAASATPRRLRSHPSFRKLDSLGNQPACDQLA